MSVERLTSAAIFRAGKIEDRGFKSHAELRRALGDENPYEHTLGDREGFATTKRPFVDRREARFVGVASGQLSPMWEECHRDVLSSDIDWDARREPRQSAPLPTNAAPLGPMTRQQRRAAEREALKYAHRYTRQGTRP